MAVCRVNWTYFRGCPPLNKPFAMVTHELTDSLDAFAHKIYTFLRGRAGKRGVCQWSQQAIADQLKIGVTTVRQRIKFLVDAGLVVAKRTGRASFYEVTSEPTARQLSLFVPVEKSFSRDDQNTAARRSEHRRAMFAATPVLITEIDNSKKIKAAALRTAPDGGGKTESCCDETPPPEMLKKIPEWLREFVRRAGNDLGDPSDRIVRRVIRSMRGAQLPDLTALLLKLDARKKKIPPQSYGWLAIVIEEEMHALWKRRTNARIDSQREADAQLPGVPRHRDRERGREPASAHGGVVHARGTVREVQTVPVLPAGGNRGRLVGGDTDGNGRSAWVNAGGSDSGRAMAIGPKTDRNARSGGNPTSWNAPEGVRGGLRGVKYGQQAQRPPQPVRGQGPAPGSIPSLPGDEVPGAGARAHRNRAVPVPVLRGLAPGPPVHATKKAQLSAPERFGPGREGSRAHSPPENQTAPAGVPVRLGQRGVAPHENEIRKLARVKAL